MGDNLDKRTKRLLAWTVQLSLLLHAIMAAYLRWPTPLPAEVEPSAIEIVEAPNETHPRKIVPPTKRSKEIVESEKLDNNEIDPNSQLLSDRNQKAKTQTRAKQTDDFRKHQGSGLTSQAYEKNSIPPTQAQEDKPQAPAPALEGIPMDTAKQSGVKRDWKTLSMKDLSLGNGLPMGATDDRLENIPDGNDTVLSTREFQYYSYYHRIKETLRQYWKPTIERRLAMVWNRGGRLKEGEMVTQLLVMLDHEGAIAKISTVASSGITDIDEAAVDAFNRAGPFPNPPPGIIDRDGLVRIRWDFILKAQAGPAIQFRRPSGMPPY